MYLENSDKVILYTGADLKAVSRNQDGAFLKDLRFGNNITNLEHEVSLQTDSDQFLNAITKLDLSLIGEKALVASALSKIKLF